MLSTLGLRWTQTISEASTSFRGPFSIFLWRPLPVILSFWAPSLSLVRATPAVSQNREQKPFLDAKGEKRCSSSIAIAGAKIWLLNSDKTNLAKYS